MRRIDNPEQRGRQWEGAEGRDHESRQNVRVDKRAWRQEEKKAGLEKHRRCACHSRGEAPAGEGLLGAQAGPCFLHPSLGE